MYIETAEDYRIKYEGCYTKHNGTIIRMGHFYHENLNEDDYEEEEHNGEEFEVMCEFSYTLINNNGVSITRTDTIPAGMVDYDLLPVGAINLKKSVIYLFNNIPDGPTKYRKLVHPNNLVLHDPFAEERTYLSLPQVPSLFNHFICKAWAEYKMFSPQEALDLVLSGKRIAAAFDKEYYIGVSLQGSGTFLFYGANRVGRVNKRGEVFLKTPVHFLYEQLVEFGFNVRLQK